MASQPQHHSAAGGPGSSYGESDSRAPDSRRIRGRHRAGLDAKENHCDCLASAPLNDAVSRPNFRFCQPSSPDLEAAAAELLHEYLEWVLELESFARDVPTFRKVNMGSARLPDVYKPPDGQFILATWQDRAAGCVALAPRAAESAELERLFVRPEFRGQGLARALVRRVVLQSRRRGHRRLYLESHVSMTVAHCIYKEEGFLTVDPPHEYPAHLRRAIICMERLEAP